MVSFYVDRTDGSIPDYTRFIAALGVRGRVGKVAEGDFYLTLARVRFVRGRPVTAALVKRAIAKSLQAYASYSEAGLGFRARTVAKYIALLRHKYHQLEAEGGFHG